MKKITILIITVIVAISVTQAQTGAVPLAYDKVVEWSKMDPGTQKTLLAYASAGKYNTLVTIEADSITQTTMVKGVKSRSGKTEDQVWLQVKKGGKENNYLFALTELPKITGKCCQLTIGAMRGDSDAVY